MSVEKGSAFLLKVANGGSPVTYATIAGLRTTQLSINGEAVNVTTKDSGGWSEDLATLPDCDKFATVPKLLGCTETFQGLGCSARVLSLC